MLLMKALTEVNKKVGTPTGTVCPHIACMGGGNICVEEAISEEWNDLVAKATTRISQLTTSTLLHYTHSLPE